MDEATCLVKCEAHDEISCALRAAISATRARKIKKRAHTDDIDDTMVFLLPAPPRCSTPPYTFHETSGVYKVWKSLGDRGVPLNLELTWGKSYEEELVLSLWDAVQAEADPLVASAMATRSIQRQHLQHVTMGSSPTPVTTTK